MHEIHTRRRAELGLLAVLVAIADTGSVSAAAVRLSLSQPAVSHALKRLRDLTADPLFERVGSKMVPTAKACPMIEAARDIVEGAHALLSPRDFSPRRDALQVKIAVSDYALALFGRAIVKGLQLINPSTQVSFVPVGPHSLDDLLSLTNDFVFSGDIGDPRCALPIVSNTLFMEHYIGVMCRSHPLAPEAESKKMITLDAWLSFDHARFTNGAYGTSSIDRALSDRSRERRFAFMSPSHRENLELLRDSEAVLSLPAKLRFLVDDKAFIVFALPVEVPAYPYFLLHHQRVRRSPAMQYMLNFLLKLCSEPL